MPQMVEHAEEQHQIKLLIAKLPQVVHVELPQLDVQPELLARELRLRQVDRVMVHAEHADRAAPLHLERVEAAVAADVEHRLSGEVRWHGPLELPPEGGREVPERM